jgi:PEP-CTERM motif
MLRNLFSSTVALVAAAILLAGAPASAALILDSASYNAHVRSGATTGIEKHAANFAPDLVPTVSGVNLPADNSMLAGLSNGVNLDVSWTEAAQHAILTISRASIGDAFVNPLDNNFALPIEFDGYFYSNSLPAGNKIAINSVQIEALPAIGVSPFPAPGSQVITGLGTQANPLRVQLGIAANQLRENTSSDYEIKIHLLYSNMVVPEPATAALMLLGLVGCVGLGRRR